MHEKLTKSLKHILTNITVKTLVGDRKKTISQLCIDSRKVNKGSLFVATTGTKTDGHHFIPKAIQQGAIAIICEKMPEDTDIQTNITYIQVADSTKIVGIIAANFYDHPSQQLKLVGITGTNGKTTTATLLFKLFRKLGYHTGLISTIQYQINEQVFQSTHTTPDAISLNQLLAKMVDAGCDYCFMEVSSHAVAQQRIAGLQFAGGVFSNLSHDHIGYHGSFAAYLAAKKAFFDQLPKKAFALSNIDDRRGMVMLQNTEAKKQTYSLKQNADFKGKILENTFEGLVLNLDGQEVHTLLIGEFNAYNLLAVYSTAILLEEEKIDVLTALSQLKTAEGRFDYVQNPMNITGIVDYAHTPDALEKVLQTIHQLRTNMPNEQVITLVGCGGDRDRDKRPIMAKIACQLSDRVILTSDNPRTEVPEAIVEDMKKGIEPQWANKVLTIINRQEAIKTASMLAKNGDIILVAGKGHEKYQEINGVRRPFDDKLELKQALELFSTAKN